jgi:preprotein translocase subunit YajC
MISYALGHFIFLAWFWVAILNRQTRQQLKQDKQINAVTP